MPDARPEPTGAILQKERQVLEACLEALRELVPTEWQLQRASQVDQAPRGADHRLDLVLAGTRIPFAVEVKHALRPTHVGALTHLARQVERRGERLLVCADRIPDQLGTQLRGHEIAYVDRGGNAWVQGPGIFVLVTGRPPVGRPRQRRYLRGTDVRLLGTFLMDPGAGELVQADLARRAGIALGAVGPGRETLTRLGILERIGKRRWLLRNREEGLRRFAEGWAAQVRPKLAPVNCRLLAREQQGELEARLEAVELGHGCLLGGELAAAHLTKYLQTDNATLHVPPLLRMDTMKALALVPDELGHVTVLDRYGMGDEYQARTGLRIALAHPLLVWAECLTIPDERVKQTAERLYESLLRGDDG